MMAIRLIFALGAALALSGCLSMRTPMTDFATDYNRVIADTRNEMILLNIVRSMRREPTHYSALGSINGNVSVSASAGAGLSGIIDDIDASASTGISVRSGPSFSVVPLSSSDFSRGILRPIEADVVRLFSEQGWGSQILIPLFVERIECGGRTYVNDPREYGSGGPVAGGRNLRREEIFALRFTVAEQQQDSINQRARMTINIDDSDAIGRLLDEFADDYSVQLHQVRREGADGETVRDLHVDVYDRTFGELAIEARDDTAAALCGASDGSGIVARGTQITLRSVEGVVYYLGELMRSGTALTSPDFEIGGAARRGQHVFRIFRSPPPEGYSVHVNHRGEDFFVADGYGVSAGDGREDRTIQVIALINQLIALQTSNEALERSPSTLTIN